MIYVALLRGINVGGKNKIDMTKLKTSFENRGLNHVKTYINSGNIIFQDESRSNLELVGILEKAIRKDFGFSVKVLLRDFDNIKLIAGTLPDKWVNDKTTKCDVMFLWENFASQNVLDKLTIKSGIDDLRYAGGAIIWRVNRDKIAQSGLMKIAGSEIYQHMTIRNCNTLRKIYQLINQ